MTSLILVDDHALYCSMECAREGTFQPLTGRFKTFNSIQTYAKANWEWTEEDGQGSLYGELCPICETNYQDALDPEGKQERY